MTERKIIDLTKEIYEGMDVYPGDPNVTITIVKKVEDDGWELRDLCMGTHTGTHVDAFSHMSSGGENLSQISLENFFGPAQMVNTKEEFPKNIGLIFESGAITMEVVQRILKSKAPFIATDENCVIQIDAEKELLSNQVLTFENLVNTSQLPENEEFLFLGLPLKIKDSDGSPVRAVAIIS